MCFTWQGKWEKFGDVLAKEKVTLSWLVNSNMIKPENIDHLHLFYHFTVLLMLVSAIFYQIFIFLPNDNSLKTKKKIYFIDKALFVFKIFNFL